MRSYLVGVIPSLVVCALVSCSGSNGPVLPGNEIRARVAIDSTSAMPGQTVEVCLRLMSAMGPSPIDSIQSFDFRISYDDSALLFLDAVQLEADSAWEYFTYRHHPTGQYAKLGTIRVTGMRDLNNGDNHPAGQLLPVGPLFRMQFVVTSDRTRIGSEPEITFWSNECTDNVLVDAANSEHLHLAQRILSNTALSQMADTLECPRRYSLTPDLELISGAVRILEPPDDRPGAPITVSVGNVHGGQGDTVEIQITIDYNVPPFQLPPRFGGLDLALVYDTSAMAPIGIVAGPQLSGWEFFTWRNFLSDITTYPRRPGIRIVSILELNNGVPSSGLTRPKGSIAVVRFLLLEDISPTEGCLKLAFRSEDVGDNVITDMSGDIVFMPLAGQTTMEFGPGYAFEGCGGIADSCEHIIKFRQTGCTP